MSLMNKKKLKKLYKRNRAFFSSIKFYILFNFLKDKNISNINLFEKSIYSQNGEDGIIEYIFYKIKTTNKFYVEFGVEDGAESNTRYLRLRKDWKGLLMDGKNKNKQINLRREFITAENIEKLFKKYNVPKNIDLLSIDIDFNDYYVWKAIKKYNPRLVIIEYNSSISPPESKVVKYNSKRTWDGTNYFGASLLALKKLGESKGYSLICCDNTGTNAFFLKRNLFKYFQARDYLKIFKKPNYGKNNKGHKKSKEKMIEI